jgi:hypothetical protein
MTDETREQIKRDAENYTATPPQFHSSIKAIERSAFINGCEHQHPISFSAGEKAGWNEAVDAALETLRAWIGTSPFSPEEYNEFKTELEKCSPKK